ncbi:MAG TPA: TrmJ/YjtD family RNA methyltransferase [Candidatus Sulfotelmatobacter sp.]|nr:TrmJ/YjtD family RNA methyltransferase [Candidatus Sulfotelmatobacter sp.]
MSASFDLANLVVVLVRTRNPLNIGAAARAMTNFGASRLRLVNPYSVAFREAHSAVGASELLKKSEEFTTVAEAVSDCELVVGTTAARNRILQHPLHRLDHQSGAMVQKHLRAGRVAILFGSEKIGLTNEDFSHCHALLHIPTRADHVSMNLGQAVAVCLYELARDTAAEDSGQIPELAAAAVNEEITTALVEALDRSGYIKPGGEAACQKKARRMVLRLQLAAEDAKVFLGMVRQIVWRLRQSGKD